MRIRLGYELVYQCAQPTPMILHLNVESGRTGDLESPDRVRTDPPVPITVYTDVFGNTCSRLVAPPGRIRISSDTVIRDHGRPEVAAWDAVQHPVEDLPLETLVFLIGSRYCETDLLNVIAWRRGRRRRAGRACRPSATSSTST